MSEIKKEVQDLLNLLIQKENLSEREIALSAGVSQSYINKIKNGKCSLKSLQAITNILSKYGKVDNAASSEGSQGSEVDIKVRIDCQIYF